MIEIICEKPSGERRNNVFYIAVNTRLNNTQLFRVVFENPDFLKNIINKMVIANANQLGVAQSVCKFSN